MLEAQNPWIKENAHILQTIDAKEALCRLDSPQRRLLGEVPDGIVVSLDIDNTRYNPACSGWDAGEARLLELLDCPAVLNSLESVRINLEIYFRKARNASTPEQGLDGEQMPQLLPRALSQMPKLKTLDWALYSRDSRHIERFETAYQKGNLALPSIKRLRISKGLESMISLVPNVETLAIRGNVRFPSALSKSQERLVKRLGQAKHLTELEYDTTWTDELVEAVRSAAPKIRSLRMIGEVDNVDCRKEDPRDARPFKAVASGLAKFGEGAGMTLDIDLENIFGAKDLPGCGNVFEGISGKKYWRQLLRDDIWRREHVAMILLEHLPGLKSLTVDRIAATAMVNGRAIWPWTGRMKDYLLEKVPRQPGGAWSGGPEDEAEDPDGPILHSWEADKTLTDKDWIIEKDCVDWLFHDTD